ncbi:MAG: hypothetical protein SGPRY_001109 [Prymnesium sp.]
MVLLHLLASSEGASLLDDQPLIATLEEVKVTATLTQARIAEGEASNLQLEQTMQLYLPVSPLPPCKTLTTCGGSRY